MFSHYKLLYMFPSKSQGIYDRTEVFRYRRQDTNMKQIDTTTPNPARPIPKYKAPRNPRRTSRPPLLIFDSTVPAKPSPSEIE